VKTSIFAVAVCGGLALALVGTVRADVLSAGDRQIVRTAFAAARSGDFAAASRSVRQTTDNVPAKIVRWMELMRPASGARFTEITDFIQQNPEWPGQIVLRQRAEEVIAGVPEGVLREWFAKYPPITPAAKLRLADLTYAGGQREAGIAMVREMWINSDLGSADERTILDQYDNILRREDHIKRLDRLLWEDQEDAAKRMYPRVPPEYRALAEARLKLADEAPGVERLVARVPEHLQSDPGLLYERMRWRRRKEQYDGALQIALNPPREIPRPGAWWAETQVLARRALADRNVSLAYKLASRHGKLEGNALSEAEFLAGWISLRFMHDANTAYDHFVKLYDGVKLPISAARGAYWAGRAAEAMNQRQLAAAWYGSAAEHPTTYYGQLAYARLGDDAGKRPLPDPRPTVEDIKGFERRELVRATRILSESGETDRVKMFMLRLSELSKTPVEHAMVAMLAEALARPELAVAVAKRAGYAGVALTQHGYPLIRVPSGGIAETPLVLAMTRQESAFERDAVSKAGARGLMQLMPATAKNIAKQVSLPFSADRLLTDGSYNLALGRAYVDTLLDIFNGSYVMTIAAYNAGPGRVRQWVQDFGDVRSKDVDAVDWVEAIPFSETRNYVQRVLENLQVYRLRLGKTELAFSLPSDLKR